VLLMQLHLQVLCTVSQTVQVLCTTTQNGSVLASTSPALCALRACLHIVTVQHDHDCTGMCSYSSVTTSLLYDVPAQVLNCRSTAIFKY
jgi:hypothetical protein